jgi:hypothetical protein
VAGVNGSAPNRAARGSRPRSGFHAKLKTTLYATSHPDDKSAALVAQDYARPFRRHAVRTRTIDDKALPEFVWAAACGHKIDFLLEPEHRALLTRNEHRFVRRCRNLIGVKRELRARDRERLAHLVDKVMAAARIRPRLAGKEVRP